MNEMTLLREDRRRLTEDLRLLLRDTENILRLKVNEASEGYLDARARLEQTVASARRGLDGLELSARQRASETMRDTDTYVRDHPWESLGVGVGAGVLIGLIVGRR